MLGMSVASSHHSDEDLISICNESADTMYWTKEKEGKMVFLMTSFLDGCKMATSQSGLG